MPSVFAFRSTMACLRKARVTIPRLSPTHTQARIVRFCPKGLVEGGKIVPLECTDALFIVECSPDIVTEAFREQNADGSDVLPMMIVESHDEGDLSLAPKIRLGEWYNVGETLGWIDDGDDDGDDQDEWLWQAYSHEEGERELNLPPHIVTGKISK